MLNASRHRISLRRTATIRNSTFASAQRLSASDIATPLRDISQNQTDTKCSTPLGIGYRYALTRRASTTGYICAQRLSASDIATPPERKAVQPVNRVLNASRHRISLRYRRPGPPANRNPVLNASRHRISLRGHDEYAVLPSPMCSTPLGIGYRYA